MTEIVVATRSPHKLREIRDLLPPIPGLKLIDLDQAGIEPRPDEESVEAFTTFEANALAKARYFSRRSDLPIMADDSGLCVDALDGAPGVFSKRFAGRDDLSGAALDRANNRRLIEALAAIDPPSRAAHYVCAIALVAPDGRADLFRGTIDGVILAEPRGSGGFGYDPLFFVPALGATLAEVPQAEKNRVSHRARAVEAAVTSLRQLAGRPLESPADGSP